MPNKQKKGVPRIPLAKITNVNDEWSNITYQKLDIISIDIGIFNCVEQVVSRYKQYVDEETPNLESLYNIFKKLNPNEKELLNLHFTLLITHRINEELKKSAIPVNKISVPNA